MHHLKETVIDGVKLVPIPEDLYNKLTRCAADYLQYTGFGHEVVDATEDFEGE